MTASERFARTMSYATVDRPPLLEEGLRDEVRQTWTSQGLSADADLAGLFHYDKRHRLALDLGPRPAMGRSPLTSDDIALRRARLDADDPSRVADEQNLGDIVRQWRADGDLVELPLGHGLFLTMGVERWASLEPVMYQLADAPAKVKRVLDDQAALTAALADRVLRQLAPVGGVDFASFSEPIADNHGPLISPAMHRELVLASHRPVLDVLHHHGVKTIVWITYGNARALIGDVLDAGFNCLWAIETESHEMDYRALRKRFGRSLRLIGGIDLDCLLAGPDAIDAELHAKLPPLLADGGFMPLADGRVRSNVPFTHYARYRRQLERMAGAASR